MKVMILAENTTSNPELKSEHGLSIYIETGRHKLIFDLGKSSIFAENAAKLGVDISVVDTVIISHGHYDHGGGLGKFLSMNSDARIFLHKKAFDGHFAFSENGETSYIGLERSLMNSTRFVYTEGYFKIDDELELFSNVKGKRLVPSGNSDILMCSSGHLVPDNFSHEQHLAINRGENSLLFVGCAHSGIVNIIEHYHELKGFLPSCVIGGFHLYNRVRNEYEDKSVIAGIGEYLKSADSKYYTGHCTGLESFNQLKEILGEKLRYIKTGSQFCL